MEEINNKPPKIAEWILGHTLTNHDRDFVLGDFTECYIEKLNESGFLSAMLWYWFQIIKSIPRLIMNTIYWRIIMLKNYFIMAYRSLFKNKLLGTISVFSLSVAIGVAIALFVFMDITLKFNYFHENAKQIFQVENIIDRDGELEIWGNSPVPLGPAMKSDFPQITRAVRIANGSGIMKYNDKVFHEG